MPSRLGSASRMRASAVAPKRQQRNCRSVNSATMVLWAVEGARFRSPFCLAPFLIACSGESEVDMMAKSLRLPSGLMLLLVLALFVQAQAERAPAQSSISNEAALSER